MNGRDTVTAQLISPATTPGSIVGAERCLKIQVTSKSDKQNFKKKWSAAFWNLVPCYMAIISIIQKYSPLEVEQGALRTVVVYLGGGVFGALGACILEPQPMVGASAGVYALLISHLAHLYLNLGIVKYRKYRVFSVCVLSISDIGFYAFHARTAGNPPISLGAHASGGLAGALLGLVVYKGPDDETYKYKKYVKIFAFTAILLLLTVAIVAMSILPTEFFRR